MANRREFIQGAIATTALPLVTGATAMPQALTGAGTAKLPLYKAIFDERFAPSHSFAREAQRLGVTVAGFKGDITSIWFNDLRERWGWRPVAIAGLTAPAALFCLERLAWDHRMSVVFQAEHRTAANGAVQHEVLLAGDLLRSGELDAARNDWSVRVANAVSRFPANRALRVAATSAGLPRSAHDTSMTLVSWIIAPVKSA